MRRHKPKSPLWARLLIVLGTVLVVGSVGTLAGGGYLLTRYERSVHTEDLLPDDQGGTTLEGPLTVLLVGVDEGWNRTGSRSDSIILAHVPAAHDKVYLVSIPRDSYVDIPAYSKSGYEGGQAKINSSFDVGSQNNQGRRGGFDLLGKTIQQIAPGLKFDGGAIVNFDGFTKVVEALGGIDLTVDEQVTSIHIGFDAQGRRKAPFVLNPDGTVRSSVDGVKPQVYKVGKQHLLPWQALDFARQRDLLANGDGDYGRQRHQQQVLKAILKASASQGLSNPIKADKVIRAAGDALTFDGGGAPLRDWIFTLKAIDPAAIVTLKTNEGKFNPKIVGGSAVEILSPDSKAMIAAVRDDTLDSFVATHPTWVSAD
jgi:LCP family protein required for cell wall assembly